MTGYGTVLLQLQNTSNNNSLRYVLGTLYSLLCNMPDRIYTGQLTNSVNVGSKIQPKSIWLQCYCVDSNPSTATWLLWTLNKLICLRVCLSVNWEFLMTLCTEEHNRCKEPRTASGPRGYTVSIHSITELQSHLFSPTHKPLLGHLWAEPGVVASRW